MRHYAKLVLATLSLLLAWHNAQADEPPVITLSCDGTITMGDAKPEPINKMGFVVNLADHTVTFGGYVAKIDSVDAADIAFSGQGKLSIRQQTGTILVTGNINRVTGAVSAKTATALVTFTYDLLCKLVTGLL
jgi:hypothetical protein